MSDEGFQDRQRAGDDRVQARNIADLPDQTLEGPGADARMQRIQERFKKASASQERMPVSNLVMIGIFVFLMVVLFGAGRYIVAAIAPKPPATNAISLER